MIRRRFGTEWFGSFYGLIFDFVQMGVVLGPSLAAYTFDHYGSYRPVFKSFAGALIIATTLWVAASRMSSQPD